MRYVFTFRHHAWLGLGKDCQCFIKVRYKFYLDRIRKILMVPGIRAYTNSSLHSNAPCFKFPNNVTTHHLFKWSQNDVD